VDRGYRASVALMTLVPIADSGTASERLGRGLVAVRRHAPDNRRCMDAIHIPTDCRTNYLDASVRRGRTYRYQVVAVIGERLLDRSRVARVTATGTPQPYSATPLWGNYRVYSEGGSPEPPKIGASKDAPSERRKTIAARRAALLSRRKSARQKTRLRKAKNNCRSEGGSPEPPKCDGHQKRRRGATGMTRRGRLRSRNCPGDNPK
jgi:hypothetical protein